MAEVGICLLMTEHDFDIVGLARKVEELGFGSLWAPEHGVVPADFSVGAAGAAAGAPSAYSDGRINQIIDPLVYLAAATSVTKTIRLGTAVCLIPQRHPLLLANEIATLDHFSGGRFVLGAGTGWLREESEILGGDFDHRWTQAAESIKVMKEVWANDEAEYHGRYYDFPPIRSFPKPVQKPNPPIYLGGSAANVFKRVASYADGWLPTGRVSPDQMKEGCQKLRQVCEEMGRDYGSIEISAYAQPPDPDLLCQYEEAGAERAIVRAADYPGSPSLPSLEEIAEKVL